MKQLENELTVNECAGYGTPYKYYFIERAINFTSNLKSNYEIGESIKHHLKNKLGQLGWIKSKVCAIGKIYFNEKSGMYERRIYCDLLLDEKLEILEGQKLSDLKKRDEYSYSNAQHYFVKEAKKILKKLKWDDVKLILKADVIDALSKEDMKIENVNKPDEYCEVSYLACYLDMYAEIYDEEFKV